ncbi:MAG: phosphoribosyltransferase [Acidiferrobacterales bacterium]
MTPQAQRIHELDHLRDRAHVFRDRIHAGRVLAKMLKGYDGTNALVFGIPAGGVPVAATLAKSLGLALDVAVVSKMTLPWNTEVGYGAVAFDGTVKINDALVRRVGLTKDQVAQGIAATGTKVKRRCGELRGNRSLPNLAQRLVFVVDDGLASGFTMRVAVDALTRAGADTIAVAVPTAHASAAEQLATKVTAVYCPNVREGWGFAVADAYEHWSDVEESELVQHLCVSDGAVTHVPLSH